MFHTGFLKGQGVPFHRNRAGHLTLNVEDICDKTKASAHKGRQFHAASSFPATADIPEPGSLPSVQPPAAAESVLPPPSTEKKYRQPSGQKMPAAHVYKRAAEKTAERREGAGEREERSQLARRLLLPDRELNLDGMVPPPLVKPHKRLAKRSELLELHLKHYHTSSAQFRRRTSELYLLEDAYRLCDGVVKDCEIRQKTKPAPPRSWFSGVRAKDFGDVVFMGHCEVEHMSKKHQLFLVLDGAASLLWGSTQELSVPKMLCFRKHGNAAIRNHTPKSLLRFLPLKVWAPWTCSCCLKGTKHCDLETQRFAISFRDFPAIFLRNLQ